METDGTIRVQKGNEGIQAIHLTIRPAKNDQHNAQSFLRAIGDARGFTLKAHGRQAPEDPCSISVYVVEVVEGN